jgi:hypothetical protein
VLVSRHVTPDQKADLRSCYKNRIELLINNRELRKYLDRDLAQERSYVDDRNRTSFGPPNVSTARVAVQNGLSWFLEECLRESNWKESAILDHFDKHEFFGVPALLDSRTTYQLAQETQIECSLTCAMEDTRSCPITT